MQILNSTEQKQFLELTPPKTHQNSSTSLAHKVNELALRNKGSIFLSLTVLVTLALSPQILAWGAACKVVAYSLLTFSSLQIFTALIGRNEIISHRTGEQVNALLGVVNLCVLYLFPGVSLGASLLSSSVGAASLLMRNVAVIDP